jgi:probable F420-dependent oxidoreductase
LLFPEPQQQHAKKIEKRRSANSRSKRSKIAGCCLMSKGTHMRMKLGALLPQSEIGLDSGALRAFAQAAEDMGYHYLVAFDTFFSARPWHEPLTFYAFVAGCTRQLELATGVIVAPSRQTLLLAKQAASLDVLSSGRLRLGLGVGEDKAEFQALQADFRARGAHIEEQMEVLRALWTQPSVTYQGKWHHLSEARLLPQPLQRPIPIWLGGGAEAVLQRVGQMGDGCRCS